MLSYRERQRDECGLLLRSEVEGNGKGQCVYVCVCVHTPDQDYVPGGSYHTCLPLHPDLCLSGRHCTHRDSCPSHLECLGNEWTMCDFNKIYY